MDKNAADAKFKRNNWSFALLIIIIIIFAGCGAKKSVTETDVEKIVVERVDTIRDSVWVERTHIERDSVIIFQRGDTIYRDRWRTIYKDNKTGAERERVVIQHDTIQVYRDVVVQREPTTLQRIRSGLGTAAVVLLLAVLLFFLHNIRKRF